MPYLRAFILLLCLFGGISVAHAQCSFNPSTIISPVSCHGGADGSINLNVSGTTPPFTFLWSNNATTEDIQGLVAGTYTVTVSDALGCTQVSEETVTEPAALFLGVAAINSSCDLPNGSIITTVSGGVPPYQYIWNNGVTGQVITNLATGTYSVTIIDAKGCTQSSSATVVQSPPIVLTTMVTNVSCNGAFTGAISLTVNGGPAPFTFLWSNSATTPNLTSLPAGTYTVTVSDANGCTQTKTEIITQPPALGITASITDILCGGTCDGVMDLTVVGVPPYAYQWSNGVSGNGNTTGNIGISSLCDGFYQVTITDGNGCTATYTGIVAITPGSLCSTIEGRVLRDTNPNCLTDAGEPPLANWFVQAVNATNTHTYYGTTDANGDYQITVASDDTYTLSAIVPNPLWAPCPQVIQAVVPAQSTLVPAADLLIGAVVSCPNLSVDISSGVLRRCFSNNYYYVQYCNDGTETAHDIYILIQLDTFITPLSATSPYIDLGNRTLRFNVSDLAAGQCRTFNLKFNISCNAVLGQTHCTTAHIYPDDSCIPTNPQWSGASLQLTSLCSPDSVRFRIANIGTGNMVQALNYIVIEDQVMLMNSPVQLQQGQSVNVSVPANGSTWRLEIPQEPFHPGSSMPALSVEACTTGAPFSVGFVTQFPTNDADAFIDTECRQNVGSYDPNDKQGFPVGVGAAHYIVPGTPLEYQIRFQNTGTDTAFTVRIVDTLSQWLDPSTIRPGASSHPYTFSLTGEGVAQFLFENILLPDSNANEAASNGFIKFTIAPRSDAPLETLVENTAGIYFDFNTPVITNTTFHRLGRNFLTVGFWQPQQPKYALRLSPNPFVSEAMLEISGLQSQEPITLQIVDLKGVVVQTLQSDLPLFHLHKGDLQTGVYFFNIEQKGEVIGSGKFVVDGGR